MEYSLATFILIGLVIILSALCVWAFSLAIDFKRCYDEDCLTPEKIKEKLQPILNTLKKIR